MIAKGRKSRELRNIKEGFVESKVILTFKHL
jgi:hypothetical protein